EHERLARLGERLVDAAVEGLLDPVGGGVAAVLGDADELGLVTYGRSRKGRARYEHRRDDRAGNGAAPGRSACGPGHGWRPPQSSGWCRQRCRIGQEYTTRAAIRRVAGRQATQRL